MVLASNAVAEEKDYALIIKETKDGRPIIRVSNGTDTRLTCWISDGRYYEEVFTVRPYEDSRWYYEPKREYSWGCY